MNIYIYSDESGVFDRTHNNLFVFGGLIILGSDAKEVWSRKYAAAEKVIKDRKGIHKPFEIKAAAITNLEKGKLFRSLNGCYKFGAVINQDKVLGSIFNGKKDKQRYLDYAYKIAVKRALVTLIQEKKVMPKQVERLFFYVDEHTTATNGRYELKEGLEQEFRYGTYNYNYSAFFPPIFPLLKDVQLEFCNSEAKLLIRAADIVANRIFYFSRTGSRSSLNAIQNMHTIYLP